MSKDRENGILFRSSMNGYNKADVNKYIQDENIRFAAIKSDCDQRIEELERELELAKDEIKHLNEECTALQEKANELRNALDVKESDIGSKDEEIAELNGKVALLASEAESASTDNNEANRKNLDLIADNASLRERIAELEASLAEKDSVIDELKLSASQNNSGAHPMTDDEKNEFGDMLLRAKYASEDMLKRAEEGAGIIIDRAKDEMFTRRNEAVKAAKEIFNAATEELRRSIGICMNDFAAAIRNARNDSARTTEAADICDDDLSRRIERMQNDLDRAIAEKLAEFDSKN